MMSWTYLVIVLAVMLYIGTVLNCGIARMRTRLAAPATVGNIRFERAYRIQTNTLEQLVPFLAALWLFSSLVNPLFGAILGAVWLAGRLIYWIGYAIEPGKRGPGFLIAFAALGILVLGALWGAVRAIAAGA